MTLEEKSEDANNDEKPLILEDEPVDELSALKVELEDVKDKFAPVSYTHLTLPTICSV